MNYRNCAAIVMTLMLAGTLSAWAASAPLPPGTRIQVRMTDRLSSESAKPGETFHGTLAQPVIVHGKMLFNKGTEVTGQVIAVSSSGRLSSPGKLQLELTSLSSGWFRSYVLAVQPLVIEGSSHTRSNITKIGSGAAAGAVVGALAAGGKGAAIGAGVGAGTGTAVAAATGKHEAVVESEALLTWVTAGAQAAPVTGDNLARRSSYRDDSSSQDRDDDYARRGHGHHKPDADEDEDNDDERDRGGYRKDDDGYVFTAHDREILRGCVADSNSGLPPGLAKRDRLPPGLEKQLQRNGTLPPGLQKRVQPLPESCEVRLPRLPHEWQRVILGGRVILLDGEQIIHDILELRDGD